MNNSSTNISMEYATASYMLMFEKAYDKTNCYVSVETKYQVPYINGLYIIREDIIGKLPKVMMLNLYVDKDLTTNDKAVVLLHENNFQKYRTNCRIVNDENIVLSGLFTTPTICERKGKFKYIRYEGVIDKFPKVINDVIILKQFLLPHIPRNIFFELKWIYNKIPKKRNSNQNSLFPQLDEDWNHPIFYKD